MLPSPAGDAAVSRACREAAPDILPPSPIKAASIWYNEGVGSAADGLELLRMGFERASFSPGAAALDEAARLSATDANRWSKVPLGDWVGPLTLEVAAKGDGRCAAFEREVAAQARDDDPMKYWTDTRFPPAPPEGRNWCLATLASPDAEALILTRTVTSSREGQGTVNVTLETVTDKSGTLLARRALVRLYRASFPIGVSQVATGCDGAAIGPTPEFWGPSGIALTPAASPTLINK